MVRWRPIADIGSARHPPLMKELLCIVCPHVLDAARPVCLIAHHADGGWQAACGESDHRADCGDFAIVGLNHLLDRQPELAQFINLPRGQVAEKVTDEWCISDLDEDD